MIEKLNDLHFNGKSVFAFGHCNATEEMLDHLATLSVKTIAILDNNKAKQGNKYKEIPIVPVERVLEYENGMVLIANRFYEQMRMQLREIGYKGSIVKILEYNSFAEYSLLEETIKSKTERMLRGVKILKNIRDHYPNKYLVVCPHNALGDVYWAMSFLPAYLDPLVVVNGKGCGQVAQMFGQENAVLQNSEMEEFTQAVIFKKEQNCIIAHHDKIYTDNAIKYINKHFISFIDFYKYIVFGLDKFAEPVLPSCNLPFENKEGILQGKTLIISPYAKSVVLLPDEFWQKIIGEYKSKGFMVCTSVNGNEQALENTIPISFALNQAVKAVEYAGHFIGIRSGLCDVVHSAECSKKVIFPDCIYSTTKMKVSDFFALPNFSTL